VADKVVDASAIVALLFNEVRREAIVPRLRGASLHAPVLLGFEVANACLKKIRAAPGERKALLQAFSLLDELSIAPDAIDLREAIALAERMGGCHDTTRAIFGSRALDLELVTLDGDLARAHEGLLKSD
jgi:predicted nucleic acid-binding protein